MELPEFEQDTEVSVKLPVLIEAMDYHDFPRIQQTYEEVGLNVIVDEVGFHEGFYVGLVHAGKPEHNNLVEELTAYYDESLEDEL